MKKLARLHCKMRFEPESESRTQYCLSLKSHELACLGQQAVVKKQLVVKNKLLKALEVLAIPLSCMRVCRGLPSPSDSQIHLSKHWPAHPASLPTPSRNNTAGQRL